MPSERRRALTAGRERGPVGIRPARYCTGLFGKDAALEPGPEKVRLAKMLRMVMMMTAILLISIYIYIY